MKQFLPRLLLIDCCRGYNFMAKEYKVHITKYAYEQMTEIKRYIADEIYAPMAAKTFVGDEKCRHFIGRNASKASSYAGRKMAQSGVAPNGDKKFFDVLLD